MEETHARVTAVLRTLDVAELARRRDWIGGNTHGHFDEHRGWIQSLDTA